MLKALAFDVRSFFKIVNCEIGDDWFSTFEIPGELESIKRVVERDVVYFLDQEISQDDVSLIVVDLGKPAPIFNSDGIDRYVFDRIATIAKSVFTNSVSIPFSWHMHSEVRCAQSMLQLRAWGQVPAFTMIQTQQAIAIS